MNISNHCMGLFFVMFWYFTLADKNAGHMLACLPMQAKACNKLAALEPLAYYQSCLTLQLHGLQPIGLLCPCDFPGKNTEAGCHFLLKGIFPDPGIEPASPISFALAGRFYTTEPPGPLIHNITKICFIKARLRS